MENLINKIIDIDRTADQRLLEAESENKKLIENSEREAADIRENLRVAAEKRITELHEFHARETEESLSRISSECEETIKSLDEAFENSHLSIEESIFRTIVGESVD